MVTLSCAWCGRVTPGDVAPTVGIGLDRVNAGFDSLGETTGRATGGAQEDSDCLLALAWQKIYEAKAGEIVRRLLK